MKYWGISIVGSENHGQSLNKPKRKFNRISVNLANIWKQSKTVDKHSKNFSLASNMRVYLCLFVFTKVAT